VSNFRTIWVAALAAPLLLLIADAAVAQNATAADQSGKVLAGLRPPHEHHKVATAKTGPAKSYHDAATKVARKPAKRRPAVAASSTTEVPRRAATNLNSHIANSHTVNSRIANSRVTNSPITWPSVERAAAEETSTPPTALQFATEDTASNTVPATTTVTATPAKAKPAATDERKDSGTVDMRPTASKLVQTERFEAPPASHIFSQAPSEMPSQQPTQIPSQAASPASSPAPTQTPIAAPARQEMTPANRASSAASILVTLAGAITAGLVGWLMFGFGSARTIRVSREPAAPMQYLPFAPLR
jgi:hypothetical protein